MKTHYEPYPSEFERNPFCKTIETENTETDTNWNYVTCKKCLKLKDKAKISVAKTEEIILNQMQEFVDFTNQNISKQ